MAKNQKQICKNKERICGYIGTTVESMQGERGRKFKLHVKTDRLGKIVRFVLLKLVTLARLLACCSLALACCGRNRKYDRGSLPIGWEQPSSSSSSWKQPLFLPQVLSYISCARMKLLNFSESYYYQLGSKQNSRLKKEAQKKKKRRGDCLFYFPLVISFIRQTVQSSLISLKALLVVVGEPLSLIWLLEQAVGSVCFPQQREPWREQGERERRTTSSSFFFFLVVVVGYKTNLEFYAGRRDDACPLGRLLLNDDGFV